MVRGFCCLQCSVVWKSFAKVLLIPVLRINSGMCADIKEMDDNKWLVHSGSFQRTASLMVLLLNAELNCPLWKKLLPFLLFGILRILILIWHLVLYKHAVLLAASIKKVLFYSYAVVFIPANNWRSYCKFFIKARVNFPATNLFQSASEDCSFG